MTVLQNFNNYMIGLCGYRQSANAELESFGGVFSTNVSLPDTALIVFYSEDESDTAAPTIVGTPLFTIVSASSVVDTETSVTVRIIWTSGTAIRDFNRIGLMLMPSGSTDYNEGYLILCDEFDTVSNTAAGEAFEFEYTVDLSNFLEMYDPQVTIDISGTPAPTPTYYSFSNSSVIGEPVIDKESGVVSEMNYNNCLEFNLNNAATGPVTTMDIQTRFLRSGNSPAGILTLRNQSNEAELQIASNGNTIISLGPAASNAPMYTRQSGSIGMEGYSHIRVYKPDANSQIKVYYKDDINDDWTEMPKVSGNNLSYDLSANLVLRTSSIPTWSYIVSEDFKALKVIINGIDMTPSIE